MHRGKRTLQIGLAQFLRGIDALRHAGAISAGAGFIGLRDLGDAVRDPFFVLRALLRGGGKRHGKQHDREHAGGTHGCAQPFSALRA